MHRSLPQIHGHQRSEEKSTLAKCCQEAGADEHGPAPQHMPQREAMGEKGGGLMAYPMKAEKGFSETLTFYPACEAVTFHMVCFLESQGKGLETVHPPPTKEQEKSLKAAALGLGSRRDRARNARRAWPHRPKGL